jgi:chemotaxis protein MotB
MKKLFYVIPTLSMMLILFFTSCEPTKQLTVTNPEVDRLNKENTNARIQLKECNSQVESLVQEKITLQNELTLSQGDKKADSTLSSATIAQQAKKIKDFQNKMEAQKTILYNLKNSIAEALINYENDELYITVKNGKVYVSLEEKLLFKSGSDVVDKKGKEALKTLAKILNTTGDITVMIEGHTDNLPIKTKIFEDNWDLSTARATSILRILTVENGFDPTRIAASGMSQYHPIKTNETVIGRANNRRTEVILSPDLNELFNVLFAQN